MATALRPLQTAIYAKLNAVLPGKVYDEVPEPATYPYVEIGSSFEYPDDQHDAQGVEALVTIHVWSKAPGFGEAYDTFAVVDAALDRAPLAVAGWTDVYIKLDQHQALKDPDPAIRHINAQYRVIMTKE